MLLEKTWDVWLLRAVSTENDSAGFMAIEPPVLVLVVLRKGVASTRVFHSLQAGHWPAHLTNSLPQELQKKTMLDLAMT